MSISRYALQAASGNGGESYWLSLYGTTGDERAYGSITDASGNIYVVGSSNPSANTETLFLKLDASGSIIWSVTLDGASLDVLSAITFDPSGDIIVCGLTNDGFNKTLVAKYDTDGDVLWQVKLGAGSVNNAFAGLCVDSSGDIYCGINNNSITAYDTFIQKLSGTDGSSVWGRRYVDTNVQGKGLYCDSSDNIWFTLGQSVTSSGKAVIVKFNTSGTILFQKAFQTGSTTYRAQGLTTDSSGNIYVATSGGTALVFIKYNSSGTVQWKKYIAGTAAFTTLSAVLNSAEDTVYFSFYYNTSPVDMYIVALNASTGAELWQNKIGGSSNTYNFYNSLHITDKDALILTCFTASDGAGGNDMLILKAPSDGTGTGTYGSISYATSSLSITTTSGTDTTPTATTSSVAYTPSTTTLTEGTFSGTQELFEITP